METAPSFDRAVERLQRFATEQGWPSRLTWRLEGDILLLPRPQYVVRFRDEPTAMQIARDHYEAGLYEGVGISLEVLCELRGASCATVAWTTDRTEAEYRLLPELGLKLAASVDRLEGSSVGRTAWWFAKHRRRWLLRELD